MTCKKPETYSFCSPLCSLLGIRFCIRFCSLSWSSLKYCSFLFTTRESRVSFSNELRKECSFHRRHSAPLANESFMNMHLQSPYHKIRQPNITRVWLTLRLIFLVHHFASHSRISEKSQAAHDAVNRCGKVAFEFENSAFHKAIKVDFQRKLFSFLVMPIRDRPAERFYETVHHTFRLAINNARQTIVTDQN